ncbi:MAG: hypothetical protein EOP62_14280 [Sphingomonadales bacterium]|nr:MAG: hypothetical protein EOP62_14280 [Sphingomonadales bacterium]
MSDYLQLAIAAAIVIAVFYSVHRHGRGNPEGTGALDRRMQKVEQTLKGCATRGSLDLLAEQVRNLEAHAASSGEVAAIEGKINLARAEIQGVRDLMSERISGVAASAKRTEEGVQRIEKFFLEAGMQR